MLDPQHLIGPGTKQDRGAMLPETSQSIITIFQGSHHGPFINAMGPRVAQPCLYRDGTRWWGHVCRCLGLLIRLRLPVHAGTLSCQTTTTQARRVKGRLGSSHAHSTLQQRRTSTRKTCVGAIALPGSALTVDCHALRSEDLSNLVLAALSWNMVRKF